MRCWWSWGGGRRVSGQVLFWLKRWPVQKESALLVDPAQHALSILWLLCKVKILPLTESTDLQAFCVFFFCFFFCSGIVSASLPFNECLKFLSTSSLSPSQSPDYDGRRGPAGEGVGPEAALSPHFLGQTLPDQWDLLAAQCYRLHVGTGERLCVVSLPHSTS